MSYNENKHLIEEKTRIAILKHRGDVSAVVADTGFDAQYIRKIKTKMRKSVQKNPALHIANSILQTVLFGHEQRLIHYKKMLDNLDSGDFELLSNCCKAPVRRRKIKRKNYIYCTFCNTECKVSRMDATEIKIEVLESLRNEDEAMIKFAKSLGFIAETPSDSTPTPVNNVYVLNGKVPKSIDRDVAAEIQSVSPMERGHLIKNIEAKIIDAL